MHQRMIGERESNLKERALRGKDIRKENKGEKRYRKKAYEKMCFAKQDQIWGLGCGLKIMKFTP